MLSGVLVRVIKLPAGKSKFDHRFHRKEQIGSMLIFRICGRFVKAGPSTSLRCAQRLSVVVKYDFGFCGEMVDGKDGAGAPRKTPRTRFPLSHNLGCGGGLWGHGSVR